MVNSFIGKEQIYYSYFLPLYTENARKMNELKQTISTNELLFYLYYLFLCYFISTISKISLNEEKMTNQQRFSLAWDLSLGKKRLIVGLGLRLGLFGWRFYFAFALYLVDYMWCFLIVNTLLPHILFHIIQLLQLLVIDQCIFFFLFQHII